MMPTGFDWALKLQKQLLSQQTRNPDAKVYTFNSEGGADFNDLNDAIAACVDYRGDTIKVLPKSDGSSHKHSEIIDFNVIGLTVEAAELGMPRQPRGEAITICPAADYTDGPAAKITQPVHLKGLGFTTRYILAGDADSCGLLIDCEETGGFNGGFSLIEECRFSCWYGAQAYGVYGIGGAWNVFKNCTWDGLFGGFGTAGAGLSNDVGGQAPCWWEFIENEFSGLNKPAVKFITGAVPINFLMLRNKNMDGWGGRGTLLDNNSVVSGGLVAENLTGLANKAAAFLNLTNSNISFCDNKYEE